MISLLTRWHLENLIILKLKSSIQMLFPPGLRDDM